MLHAAATSAISANSKYFFIVLLINSSFRFVAVSVHRDFAVNHVQDDKDLIDILEGYPIICV